LHIHAVSPSGAFFLHRGPFGRCGTIARARGEPAQSALILNFLLKSLINIKPIKAQ